MNCHQILSGACNAGDRCFAVGSVEGVPFTAYAAGCNIVILASSFERVQIIPGATHGYIKISALDCSTDTGKIAASYENKICIFEPTPILPLDKNQSHILDYRWVQTGFFQSDSNVATLSWNLEGTRLLTGGSSIQLWKEKNYEQQQSGVKFTIGADKDNKSPGADEIPSNWEIIWSCETAIPVYHMAFNPDGTLFATCGRNDRLVKIWYENKQVLFPTKNTGKQQLTNESDTNYAYVYIAHPRAVTNIAWRKTSKYMPKGSVSNMLVTSCLDNICRIWIETVLPDDGLVNMTQFDPLASQNPKFRTQRHKHRFMQRLKHMKTCFHIRRHFKFDETNSNIFNPSVPGPIPTLPSSCSVHDFHSYGFQSTGVSPGMHFHLAASINAETDIPLVPSMQMLDPSNQNSFILHWVNNKDMHFSLQADAILQEFAKKVMDEENLLSNQDCAADTMDDIRVKNNHVSSKSMSIDESNPDESITNKYINNLNNVSSLSNTASVNSLNNDHGVFSNKLSDSLEIKIECLLRDWHQSPDLLFAIHPIDGSFLIWVVDWLDDYYPGLFRQAQVSFSTRIPSAFPLGDAMSMSTSVSLYNTGLHPMVFKEIINVKSKSDDCTSLKDNSIEEDSDSVSGKESKPDNNNKSEDSQEDKAKEMNNLITNVAPAVSMVTKHSNGTLNLWQLTFAFKTKFTQVLSIGHVCRASGHRFRVNDITCHPVLPLLVSTSHHNITDVNKVSCSNLDGISMDKKDVFSTSGFCSELILWRVDSVGPLGHSGGISELARINSPEISAFSNVAWIPTLLPSTTLGNFSNSPSACFVASDGENLRVYQAVIDARTLLAEISSENLNKLHKTNSFNSIYSNSSSILKCHKLCLSERLKVVSQQSTARPGCIIELDIISDAKHDWQNTQFLHVFQSQLITGNTSYNDVKRISHSFGKGNLDAIVDLQRTATFQEPFFIVIIEKTISGSTLHMWRIIISSKEQSKFSSESAMYVPDSNLIQDVEDGDGVPLKNPFTDEKLDENVNVPQISILTEKVCTQDLPLPEGVDVIHASPAAGHLSSSSIYPACFAPYIIVTACSDSISRFWKCEYETNYMIGDQQSENFVWSEWKMFSKGHDSSIEIPGQPLNISAAYSGRIACAYKYGKSFTRPHKGDSESRYVNLCVGIFECESTGGSEWVLEDTIHLKNIHLPRINADLNIDLNYLLNNKIILKKQRFNQVFQSFTYDDLRSPRSGETTPDAAIKSPTSILAVPSFSTLQSLRKSIAENGNTCPLTQKHLVQLDWVSKEDGSHILTVAVGSKILLYTQVSSDVAQANIKAMKESRSVNRPILRKASSLVQPHFTEEIRWMKLRQIDLKTADGLPPLPMQISWVRDGILVVAMDSEMHVYSQWKPKFELKFPSEDLPDTRNLRDEDLRSLVNENNQFKLKSVTSMSLINKISTNNLQLLSNDKKRKVTTISVNSSAEANPNDDYMTDMGLFQASRIACPVLPQYHPKQLMELLNSGKIRWVKAILSHLVRCISRSSMSTDAQFENENPNRQRSWSRSRALSVSYVGGDINLTTEHRGSTTQITEELMLDYAEIASIPPLPLWMLLNADKEETGNVPTEQNKGYDDLFEVNAAEESLDDLLVDNEVKKNERRLSHPDKQHISHFGPRQGQQLSRFLTHTHLPGLSSLDQMHLLALADTMSTFNTDFSDKFVNDPSKSAFNKENPKMESLDDCGLRFLLAMKHFTYLLRCLPLSQRAQFQKQGIGTSNIVWAFHSENEEELLNLIPSYTKGELKWSSLRELGVGFWIKNINTLRICFEKLAKSAYQAKQEPLDAALYYLAMKKKSIVWGLFRSKRDEKMTTFFSNNFSEDRWRKAALKNAFVLLGKQRFEHAVAFFLLANSLNDAIEVCINKLDDFQLALIIARLYEGEIEISSKSIYRKLLCEEILGYDENDDLDITKAHPDPFLRSITFWILKKYQQSLSTLLTQGVGLQHNDFKEEDILKYESQGTNPNVFNFYRYLRTHPLLVRQNIALTAQEKKISQVVISGFSHSNEAQLPSENEKQLLIEDSISPIERQLYFTTAYAHFKAGCPALALDVLNKLPFKVTDASNTSSTDIKDKEKEHLISTGMFNWELSFPNENKNAAADFDWSAPITRKDSEEFKIQWNDEETSDKEEDENADDIKTPEIKISSNTGTNNNPDFGKKHNKMDIMAQQLKFVACLKILMEELSTLATGFEVDGGHLRYQLYVWLEKEVEALTHLCNYCDRENFDPDYDNANEMKDTDVNLMGLEPSGKLSLHDILLQEKMDFEAKVKRAAKRKRWLKANETLLRTLLSYCSLHGASGGGLASVRMEIILLLQELQQDKTQQQLLSPLPFPTTLPLLSACVAGNKTVIADPIKYLQAQTVDMLQTVIRTSSYPGEENATKNDIFLLRDLAIALSSCIYQSLCDSESFVLKKSSLNGFQSPYEVFAKFDSSFECSHLIGSSTTSFKRRKLSTDESAPICTSPSKWPGVTNLRALLAREKDDDIPKLNVLLLESFVATYMALACYSLAIYDTRILYRLVSQTFSYATWSLLFGGGVKKLLRKATSQTHISNMAQQPVQSEENADENSSVWNTVTSITKDRLKLNMKLLGTFGNSSLANTMKEDKPTYREQFVPPELSMLSYLLLKPNDLDADFDTDDESSDSQNEDEYSNDDDDDDLEKKTPSQNKTEHTNPDSYSWSILKVALIKMFSKKVQDFANTAGVEVQDLPVLSPLSHEILRTLSRWEEVALNNLISKGPAPANYIPGCYVEVGSVGPKIHKYRSILNKENTPFVSNSSSGAIRRLWNYLVRQETVQDIFIKSIFGKKQDASSKPGRHLVDDNGEETNSFEKDVVDPIRIIHKDHESIQAFCVNSSSNGLISIANPREIQELDISLLLESPNWYEDECDYDFLNLSKDGDSQPNSSYMLAHGLEQSNEVGGTANDLVGNLNSQSGRGTSLILKHKIDNVKKMSSHPFMPLYLTGGQDGSVQIWEWGHKQVICTPRTSGTFAKVTRCRFSDQGNKFGIADGDGNLSLWQAAMASQNNRPFFTYQCHNKVLSDFVFLGSCSLMGSAGQSSENKNVNIWDTLLPQKKACVSAFTCHEQGASCIAFAPQHQLLLSCGKKGDICIFDIRQRLLKHRFLAHESSIKCIAIDPHEEFFATASVEGDIKIWDFAHYTILNTFNGEHSKNSFFKHMGQGVNQLHIDSFGRLFSCGADGCMKVRMLIDKDPVFQSHY